MVNLVGCARQVFDDAYKSPLGIIVVDNIERLLGIVVVHARSVRGL